MPAHLIVLLLWTLAIPATGQVPAFDQATFESVRSLLKEGRFAEAVATLEPITAHPGGPPAALYLLSLVHLQAGDLPAVESLLGRLRTQPGAAGASYASKLAPVLASAYKEREFRDEFAAALKKLDQARARQVLATMDLAAEQRMAVNVYLDAYAGRLTSALLRLNAADMEVLPEQVRDPLRNELVLAANRFKDLTEQLRWYTNTSLAASACQPADARERSVRSELVLAEYVYLTELALQLFPLNPQFMDAAFHGALLSASYEELKALGDDILEAKGSIRIPFFSSTGRFFLVIDQRSRRLYTELDPLEPRNMHGSEDLSSHTLFDHPYRAVRKLQQRAGTNLSTGSLRRDSYAVKLEPSGQAPHYLFMPLVHCLYGEEAQKAITRNLGSYIQHVLAVEKSIDVDLEHPAKHTRDRLQLFSQIVGTSTIIAAGVAEQSTRGAELNDGRMSTAEVLQQTTREAETLMTRRQSLLKAQAALRESQRASKRTWSEALADSALSRARFAASARVDELIALVDVR